MTAPPDPEAVLSEEERKLLDTLAARIVELRMETPAIFMLESMKPLNFVGAQLMHFMAPVVGTFYGGPHYDRIAGLLEKREAIEALIRRIEAGIR